jgi:nitroreductase
MRMDSATDSIHPLIRTRQYREFTSEPLTDEELRTFAEAARWTGSGGNSQPWRFVVVRDVALLRRIGAIAMPQTRSLNTATAALAISMPNDPESEVISAYDEGRVAERVLIAASMLNLGAGITWIREQFRREIEQLLGLGDDRFVRTIVALGHPTDAARAPRSDPGQARRPLDELVTWR